MVGVFVGVIFLPEKQRTATALGTAVWDSYVTMNSTMLLLIVNKNSLRRIRQMADIPWANCIKKAETAFDSRHS